ncbi:uncharacterized protein TNCV_1125721 [Trichonephila clavipes]|nr:uncharacterized protein TNCV_1125721 [Trichonephila clavipes]
MIYHTCSIGDRYGDIAGQDKMSTLCRARCVTTAVSNVFRQQRVGLQAYPWHLSVQHTAITGTKAVPAFPRKHNRSPLRPPMSSGLTSVAP